VQKYRKMLIKKCILPFLALCGKTIISQTSIRQDIRFVSSSSGLYVFSGGMATSCYAAKASERRNGAVETHGVRLSDKLALMRNAQ
jgi:hypothetical protein